MLTPALTVAAPIGVGFIQMPARKPTTVTIVKRRRHRPVVTHDNVRSGGADDRGDQDRQDLVRGGRQLRLPAYWSYFAPHPV
jgi:hypothetical protein